MIRESQERKTYQNTGFNNNNAEDVLGSSIIQQIFQQYKINASTYEGTQKIFEIIQLSNSIKKDPSNPIIQKNLQQKLQITKQIILKSKQQSASQFTNYQFDINKFFMTNKSGSFGTIEKKCKFTQKGVLEYENQKSQPKLKQIIGFISFIQMYAFQVRHSKLPWLKQPSGNQNRIILIDKNKAQKAVYFTTKEEASSARVYLIQKYKSKIKNERIKQILMSSKNQLSNKISQAFVQKLLYWHKNQNKQQKSQKDLKVISQRSQQKSSKQIKLFDNLNNKSSKQLSLQKNKLDDSMFDIDRDSHPLSQFYFGQKKQHSQKNIFVQDSKTQVGFKKSSNNKIKQIQKIVDSNKRKFIPYGFGQKLKRYNKANIQGFMQKWRWAIQQIELKNIQNKQIAGETQLFSILKNVAQRQVKKGSKQNKRGDEQKYFLVFDKLSLRLSANTMVPFKLQLQVVILSTKGSSQQKQRTYTTFQSINEQQNGNLLYDLIQINNNNDQIDKVNKNIQLQGSMDKYQIRLKLKQKITEDILVQKDLLLRELKLFSGKFTVEMLVLQNSNHQSMGNENQSGLISCQIQGKLLNQKDIIDKNNQNKIKDNNREINNNNMNLISKILHFISSSTTTNQQGNLQNNNEINEIEDEFIYFKKLINKIPVLEESIRRELQYLISSKESNNNNVDKINISSLFTHVGIDQLSSLKPTSEEYELLNIIYTVLNKVQSLGIKDSSNILHLHILRHLQSTGLFKTKLQLLEAFLSIIINWTQCFLNCSKQQYTSININNNNNNYNNSSISISSPFTKSIGLDDNLTSIQQKLSLLKLVTQYILTKQCPQLIKICQERNIPIVLLIIDYCNGLLTKNIQSSKLWLMVIVELFMNKSKNITISVEIGFVLIAVYMCKMVEQELVSNSFITLQSVKEVLQSIFNKKTNSNNYQIFSHYINLSQSIFTFVNTKYQQLFSSQSALQQLQKLRTRFYTIESSKLQQKNINRQVEKTQVINSLPYVNLNSLFYNNVNVNNSNSQLNKTTKCLHLYFVTLPNISGSLYLRTSSTQFQCTQYQKNPYLIIPDLSSPIKVQFIDSKSNQYSFQLKLDIGFGLFKQEVKNQKTSNSIVFKYWAGLIDQQISTQQSLYTNSKQLQNSLSSSLKISDFKQRLFKQPSQSFVYQHLQKQLLQNNKIGAYDQSGQQMLRKVKICFTENNKINQYDLFLYLTANRKITLREKIYSLFQHADKLAQQECLCKNNEHIKRLMVYDLLKLMSINIERQQFQALYQGMMFEQSQSQLPKILKAKFCSLSPRQKVQISLQQHVYQYLQTRSLKYLHYDIDVEQLVQFLQPFIVEKLKVYQETISISQGLLRLIVSSQGNINTYEFKILIKTNNRLQQKKQIKIIKVNELIFIFIFKIDQTSLPQFQYEKKLHTLKPKMLRIKGSSKQNDNLDTTFSPMKKQTFNVFNQNIHTTSKKILISSPTKKSQLAQINMQSQSRFKDKQSNMKQKSQLFIQLQAKSQHDHQSIQELNLIKYILRKAKRIIPMRYGDKCQGKVIFKQFELFEQINSLIYGINHKNHQLSSINEVYFNNIKVNNLSFLNQTKYVLQFHSDLNTQLIEYCPQIGLQNNLHHFFNTNHTQPTKIYFISTNIKSQKYLKSSQISGKIMIDYSNGIIIWQKCKVLGYFLMKREKPNKKDKKMYFVLLDGKQKIVEQDYIQIPQQSITSIRSLGLITEKNKQKWQQFI